MNLVRMIFVLSGMFLFCSYSYGEDIDSSLDNGVVPKICSSKDFSLCVNDLIHFSDILKKGKSSNDLIYVSVLINALDDLSDDSLGGDCKIETLSMQPQIISELLKVVSEAPVRIKTKAAAVINCFSGKFPQEVKGKIPSEYYLKLRQLSQECCNSKKEEKNNSIFDSELKFRLQKIIDFISAGQQGRAKNNNQTQRLPAGRK